ncbi:MAG: Beta,4-galactosyltransferase CpsIVG [Verrucomicrobia bacterium]|nr:Beta,4-galactosyltransferase CpsIVG [Verrucomicrobiota bacterium]
MIFVTVGSELPFDRLVRVVDQWAGENRRTDVFAQIAETSLKPSFIAYKQFLEPAEFSERLAAASVIVSHAGMGTILSALRSEKPILVMPRRATLREVRNEHQLATAERLAAMGRITVALDETELRATLDRIGELKPKEKISPYAGPELVAALRDFIAQR